MKYSKCSICNLPCIEDVNYMLSTKDKNYTYNDIITFVKEEYSIKISDGALSRHKRNHLLNDHVVKELQKDAIIKAQKQFKKTTNQNSNIEEYTIEDIEDPSNPINKEFVKLTKDFDAFNEMIITLAISKDRMKRAIKEESESGLILATTGHAIKDYAVLVERFKEMMSGSETIEKLRFNQLLEMFSKMLNNTTISDHTRFEIMALMENAVSPTIEEIKPIRPQSIS